MSRTSWTPSARRSASHRGAPGLGARGNNVGTGVGTAVLELAAVLRTVARATAPIEFAPPRRGEQQASFVTIEKARRELGWSPRVGLEQGLSETFAWFAARAGAAPTVTHT